MLSLKYASMKVIQTWAFLKMLSKWYILLFFHWKEVFLLGNSNASFWYNFVLSAFMCWEGNTCEPFNEDLF